MLDSILGKTKYIGHRTFTYYIPSPPARSTGYQEKEIDNLTQKIVSLGFDIVDIKVQSNASSENTGMWVILHLAAKTKAAFEHALRFNTSEGVVREEQKIELDSSIIHDEN